MTAEQNPQNYSGITVTLVGRAGSDSEFPPYDKIGERGISQVRVAVDQGYKDKNSGEWVEKPPVWITVTGRTDDIGHVKKGDKVRLDDARLEAREFKRKDDTTGQAFETRFGTLIVLESSGGPTSDTPF
jgi:single-stranded DNA-binding protein